MLLDFVENTLRYRILMDLNITSDDNVTMTSQAMSLVQRQCCEMVWRHHHHHHHHQATCSELQRGIGIV